jgi:hypothetical protein
MTNFDLRSSLLSNLTKLSSTGTSKCSHCLFTHADKRKEKKRMGIELTATRLLLLQLHKHSRSTYDLRTAPSVILHPVGLE